MFEHVDAYPGDPILSLNEDFKNDPRSEKINLSIGVYLDEQGRLPVMRAVREAESALLAAIGPRPYLPMEGSSTYRKAVQPLLFGAAREAVASQRIATVQTLGGSGALKVGADFLQAYFAGRQVWISDPSWDNHRTIFTGAGFEVQSYPYYSPETKQVDFMRMLSAIESMPKGSIVLLHACCHNPTGADLNEAQWRVLAEVVRSRALLPFFDIAYQGFGDGLDEDTFAMRYFADEGSGFLVASSFSKNFSLYGERCGSLSVVCANAKEADTVLGQLKAAIRRNYSSPPTHGARIVSAVLESADLFAMWKDELTAMRVRIKAMREGLHAALVGRMPGRDFDYVLQQHGMFSYTGLNPDQVRTLREEFGIYLVGSGRLCMAALTQESIAPAADAIVKVLGREAQQ
ncbi:MAG TPA: amino acid aminotransferase [Noviherbaspirillum sp.]|nr:amino acid aminotransferase [Noviherbaspirillum sp.]